MERSTLKDLLFNVVVGILIVLGLGALAAPAYRDMMEDRQRDGYDEGVEIEYHTDPLSGALVLTRARHVSLVDKAKCKPSIDTEPSYERNWENEVERICMVQQR